MRVIRFTIPGEPVGKGRPRADARLIWKDGKPSAMVVIRTPPETVEAERAVFLEFQRRFPRIEPHVGPVLLNFTAVFPIPSSWPKKLRDACRASKVYHTAVPDKDNVEKLIVDALTPPKRKQDEKYLPPVMGHPWVDDGQVIGGGVKVYGEVPRIDVMLQFIDQPHAPPTPGQKAAQARVAAEKDRGPQIAPQRTPHKSEKKKGGYPSKLQEAIDAALARDGERP